MIFLSVFVNNLNCNSYSVNFIKMLSSLCNEKLIRWKSCSTVFRQKCLKKLIVKSN